MPDGNVLELAGACDDLNEALVLGLVVEGQAEEFDSGRGDVVVGGDDAEVHGRDIHVVHADALQW